MKIIHPLEVPIMISRKIPEVQEEVGKLTSPDNIAGALQVVVNYIRALLHRHRFSKVQYCITLIDQIYGGGSPAVREIIEQLFIRSFDGMRKLCTQKEWLVLQSKMPLNLHAVYIHQQEEDIK